jgi:hypothetical protein
VVRHLEICAAERREHRIRRQLLVAGRPGTAGIDDYYRVRSVRASPDAPKLTDPARLLAGGESLRVVAGSRDGEADRVRRPEGPS